MNQTTHNLAHNRAPLTGMEQGRRSLTRRERLARTIGVGVMVPLTLLGGKALVEGMQDPHAGVSYTQEELANFPQLEVTVEANQGAREIAKQVDPGIIADQQGLEDLTDYIQAEGALRDEKGNPVLGAQQAVNVPLIPGMTPPPEANK